MKSSSQVLMNLKDKEMICYLIPDECNFTGIQDETPKDYKPVINLSMMRYKK